MSRLEKISSGDEVLALVLRKNILVDRSEFFSPNDYPFQLGIHMRKTGERFEPHEHLPMERTIKTTQEFLYIMEGKVKVIFYKDRKPVTKTVLNEGDAILMVSGGHEIKMIRDSKILEIKQGPYMGVEKDKVKF